MGNSSLWAPSEGEQDPKQDYYYNNRNYNKKELIH